MALHDVPAESPSLNDHEVTDEHHAKVGKVSDVLFDQQVQPRWAIVRSGMFGREHITPLAGSYVSEDGRLVLPYDRETVKHAPKVPRDHILTPDLEAELADHYAI